MTAKPSLPDQSPTLAELRRYFEIAAKDIDNFAGLLEHSMAARRQAREKFSAITLALAASEAERESLQTTLEYAFGAAKNELVARGLPLEWSPNSGLGVMEKTLISCGASVPRSGQLSAPAERLGPGNTEAGGAPRRERDAARKRTEEVTEES